MARAVARRGLPLLPTSCPSRTGVPPATFERPTPWVGNDNTNGCHARERGHPVWIPACAGMTARASAPPVSRRAPSPPEGERAGARRRGCSAGILPAWGCFTARLCLGRVVRGPCVVILSPLGSGRRICISVFCPANYRPFAGAQGDIGSCRSDR